MKAKQRLDIMFDLETMSSDTNTGLVISCAWVPFTLDGTPLPASIKPNMVYFDMNDSMMHGRTMDMKTVNWWRQQPGYADMMAVHNKLRVDYEIGWKFVFNQLSELAKIYKLYVWSRGIDFDFPLIQSSMRDANINENMPWAYYHKYDVRTVVKLAEMAGYKRPERGKDSKQHDAFDDCLFQIRELQGALVRLGVVRHNDGLLF